MWTKITAIFGIATTLIAGGNWFISNQNAKIQNVGQKVEDVRKEIGVNEVNIAKLQTAVETIQKDNAETRQDIKNFLRELRK